MKSSHSVVSNPKDCNLPGSSIHGIFQAGILEWVSISFSTCLAWIIVLLLLHSMLMNQWYIFNKIIFNTKTHIKQSYILISWQKEIEQQCDREIWSEQKLSHSWNSWSHTWLACVLCCFSHVQRFVTLWPVSQQAPLTMGFSRQEYWNGLPCPLPDLPHSEMESASLVSPALAAKFFTTSTTSD